MGTTFGAPVQGRAAAEPEVSPEAQAALEQEQVIIDENDPRLVSEDLSVNVEGDAYAQPAPPPDARYRAKLRLSQVEDSKGVKHDYQPKLTKKPPIIPYLYTAIEATLLDATGKYDGLKVYDYWVGTFMGRDGSTKVSTILSRLKRPDGQPWAQAGARMPHKAWMDLFVKALAAEPEIGVETQWGWQCQTCGEEADAAHKARPRELLGMSKFPQEQDKAKRAAGQAFSPEMKCTVNAAHGYSRAQVRIARFVALSDLAPAK